MTRKTPVNVAASVRARLLKVSKERREDFTLTLVNYASERFLYRLSKSRHRDQFVLKGAMLFTTSSPLMSLTMVLSSTWTRCGCMSFAKRIATVACEPVCRRILPAHAFRFRLMSGSEMP